MSRSTSLIRALDILTVVSGRADGTTISEIVSALDQPRSNVVRIVNTLIEYGLIMRKARRLAPTDAFFDLCTRDRYAHLKSKYRAVLHRLGGQLNELVLLGIQEGNAIIHLDYLESDHRVRVAPSPVTRHDLRHNAIGKVALARRPDLLEAIGDPDLEREVAQVRRTGIGWNRQETTEGVIVMACPGYTNHTSEPIVAVAWPITRFTTEKGQEAHRMIMTAINTIPPYAPK
jgi:DNA-binding IclR family transcriptional regulator